MNRELDKQHLSRDLVIYIVTFLVLVYLVLMFVGMKDGNVSLILKLLAFLSSGVAFVMVMLFVLSFLKNKSKNNKKEGE